MGIKKNMSIYYRNRETGKIEAKYVGCDTQSSLFTDTKLYERIVTDKDLPLDIQPTPSTPDAPEQLHLKSPNRTVWKIKVGDDGKITAQKAISV